MLGEKEGSEMGELVQKTLDVVIASYDYDKFIAVMRTKAKGRAAVMRNMFGGGARGGEGKEEEKD